MLLVLHTVVNFLIYAGFLSIWLFLYVQKYCKKTYTLSSAEVLEQRPPMHLGAGEGAWVWDPGSMPINQDIHLETTL